MVMFHSIWTLLLFLTFLGIIFWAFGSARKKPFDVASRIPLEDGDEPLSNDDGN